MEKDTSHLTKNALAVVDHLRNVRKREKRREIYIKNLQCWYKLTKISICVFLRARVRLRERREREWGRLRLETNLWRPYAPLRFLSRHMGGDCVNNSLLLITACKTFLHNLVLNMSPCTCMMQGRAVSPLLMERSKDGKGSVMCKGRLSGWTDVLHKACNLRLTSPRIYV